MDCLRKRFLALADHPADAGTLSSLPAPTTRTGNGDSRFLRSSASCARIVRAKGFCGRIGPDWFVDRLTLRITAVAKFTSQVRTHVAYRFEFAWAV